MSLTTVDDMTRMILVVIGYSFDSRGCMPFNSGGRIQFCVQLNKKQRVGIKENFSWTRGDPASRHFVHLSYWNGFQKFD
jgi:hypothetical protein